MNSKLIDFLSGFMSERRFELFKKIINNRTKYITVVLEDLFQSHNASAVLRTCDCFGIQDIHVIENSNEYDVNTDISLGSEKWLTINHYNSYANNTCAAYSELKKQGYRIIATSPHCSEVDLKNFDLLKGKVALVFGTELNGLSEQAIKEADEYIRIPMLGFTESFNISVSTAIILHHLSSKLSDLDIKWHLSEQEKQEVLLNWIRTTVKASKAIEKTFQSQIKK